MDTLKFEDFILECPNTIWYGTGGKSAQANLLLQCLINNQFGRRPEFFNDIWDIKKFELDKKGYRYYWPNDINIEYSMKDIDDNNSNALKAIIRHHGFPSYNELEEITLKGLFLTMYYSNDTNLLKQYNDKFLEYYLENNFPSKYYAYLVDKLDFLEGKDQTYGTFMLVEEDASKEASSIQDPSNLDKRRLKIGLSAYEDWKQSDEFKKIGERKVLRDSWYKKGNKK